MTSSDSAMDMDEINEKMIENISSPNGLVAIFTLGKLTAILENFTEKKLTNFDTNLLRSFYSKKHFENLNKVSLLNNLAAEAKKNLNNTVKRKLSNHLSKMMKKVMLTE